MQRNNMKQRTPVLKGQLGQDGLQHIGRQHIDVHSILPIFAAAGRFLEYGHRFMATGEARVAVYATRLAFVQTVHMRRISLFKIQVKPCFRSAIEDVGTVGQHLVSTFRDVSCDR